MWKLIFNLGKEVVKIGAFLGLWEGVEYGVNKALGRSNEDNMWTLIGKKLGLSDEDRTMGGRVERSNSTEMQFKRSVAALEDIDVEGTLDDDVSEALVAFQSEAIDADTVKLVCDRWSLYDADGLNDGLVQKRCLGFYLDTVDNNKSWCFTEDETLEALAAIPGLDASDGVMRLWEEETISDDDILTLAENRKMNASVYVEDNNLRRLADFYLFLTQGADDEETNASLVGNKTDFAYVFDSAGEGKLQTGSALFNEENEDVQQMGTEQDRYRAIPREDLEYDIYGNPKMPVQAI